MKTVCEQCERTFWADGARGRTPRYCSGACRTRACRARKAHTPIPTALKAGARFTRAVGKRPVTISGAPASSTNPDTWTTFDNVQTGVGDGYGIMLGGGLGCIDLDHCLEGDTVASWAREIIASIDAPVLFMERSMSGTGLHVFIECSEGKGTRIPMPDGGGYERYSRARFIRMTGAPFHL